jgi:hypothetical protein
MLPPELAVKWVPLDALPALLPQLVPQSIAPHVIPPKDLSPQELVFQDVPNVTAQSVVPPPSLPVLLVDNQLLLVQSLPTFVSLVQQDI